MNPLILDLHKKVARKSYREAHEICLGLIRKDVKNPVPYYVLSLIAADHGNFKKARELAQTATDYDPRSALFMAHAAKMTSILGEQKTAKTLNDAAAELASDDAYVMDMIGVVYSRTGYHELAVPLFEKAIAGNPKPANYHYNLATSLQFLGRFSEAKQSYQNTIKRNPEFYKAWSGLVKLGRQTADENYLEILTGQFEESGLSAEAKLHLGHAIAKTLEDLGQYEESLSWLQKAKADTLSRMQDSLTDMSDIFDAAKTTSKSARSRSKVTSSRTPIFVIGMPRTGTTMVDRIISSHPDVTALGELNAFAGLVKQATDTPSNLVLDADTLRQAVSIDFEKIGRSYMDDTLSLSRGLPFQLDKMPLNFFYAGLIAKVLPNSRIIALRRGAMDSCLSNYRQLFATDYSYYNYTYDLKSTAAFYRQFRDLMAHWSTTLRPAQFVQVRYEEIIHNQDSETRRLLDFCGLDWNDACLDFHQNAAPVATASSVQVRQPLYSSSIGRWKKYGSALDDLKKYLGDLAEE